MRIWFNLAHHRTQNQQKLAFGLIYLLATSAFVSLVFILGFILVRGFYTVTTDVSTFMPKVEQSYLYQNNEEWQIASAKALTIRRLTLNEIEQIASGNLKNASTLSGQDISLKHFELTSTQQLTQADNLLNSNMGALITGPSNLVAKLGSPHKIILVRQWQIAINSGAIPSNGQKLPTLNIKNRNALLEGTITNWQQLGGANIKVIKTNNTGDLISTPGSFMLLPYNTLQTINPDSTIGVLSIQAERREPNLSWAMLTQPPRLSGAAGGLSSIIINTFYMIVLTLLMAVPLGVGSALYLTHYAPKNAFIGFLRTLIDILAGVPSIIFGLFGFIVFVDFMHLGIGLLSGCLTLSLMLLPTLVKNTEEALKSVPYGYKEGSLALGANLWQTIFYVLLPAAKNGILTGIVLSAGRLLGESAALIFTLGFDYRQAESLFSSSRVLATHLYMLIKEGISIERAFAASALLALIVLLTNVLLTWLLTGRKNER
jgi:phosphate transport system permease protein